MHIKRKQKRSGVGEPRQIVNTVIYVRVEFGNDLAVRKAKTEVSWNIGAGSCVLEETEFLSINDR